jgi:hypothetical protein
MTLRTKIAFPLAAIHLVLVALCFGAAIFRPERSGLAPVFVLLADMPALLAFEPLRYILHGFSDNYTTRLLLDAGIYAVLGTAWWFVIGAFFAWIFSTLLRRP